MRTKYGKWHEVLLLATLLGLAGLEAHGQIFQELYAFGAISTNGNSPKGALVEGSDGNFYGTCNEGGQPTTNHPAGGYGTVFRITPEGSLTALAWFHGTEGLTNNEGLTNYGGYPFGAMLQATDGNFYGDSEYGLFRLSPDDVLTARGGGGAVGDPIEGGDGYLYYANSDAVFRSSFSGDASVRWSTPGTPSGGLIQASDGNFYGLTGDGGTYGFGTAYKVTPSGVLTTLVSFGGNPIGSTPAWPYGKLLQASDGNLYGVDGNGAGGQVFKLTLSGALTAFAEFGITDRGQSPNGGLIEANDGNFYGTTFDGGNAVGAQGTVFKLTPNGHLSTLFDFTYQGAVPGSGPLAGLVQGSDGNLYGTSAYGGTYGGGNIFRIIMPGPQLTSIRQGQQLVLSWRTNYTGFTLQTSAGLNPGAWSDVTSPASASGASFYVTNQICPGARFFRLTK